MQDTTQGRDFTSGEWQLFEFTNRKDLRTEMRELWLRVKTDYPGLMEKLGEN